MALKRETTAKIRELLKQNPNGLNITAIVREIRINRNTAGRYLENLMVSGQVEMRQFGMAKIYRLAQRVPLFAMLSISSELIMLLDNSQRVIYANEVLLKFLGSTQNDLYGKNIEYTSLVTVFDDAFSLLLKKIRAGLKGAEWTGELSLTNKGVIFSCRIKPAVFEEGQRGVSLILEDITERKRSELRVQESERQFRLLAENSLDMIHRHTPDDICIYISPASKTILGYDPDELIGHPVFEVLHSDDAHIVPEYKGRLNRKNHTAKISYRVRHRDGHYVWLESVLRAIFDEKTGELVEIYGVTRDISERKKAEDALRVSEERYRSLAEASQDLIFTIDRDDIVTYVNSFAAAMLRRDPAAIVGMDRASLFPRELAERQAAGLRRVFESGNPSRSDGPMAVNGEVRWFDHFLMPVVDSRGRIGSVLGVSRDITEKRKGEEALRVSEAKYRNLFENAVVGFFRSSHDGRLIGANTAYAKMYGYEDPDSMVREITNVGVQLYADPDDRNKILATLAAQGCLEPTEVRVRHRDGHLFWVSVTARTIRDAEGRILEYEGTFVDISKRKRAEEALRVSEERFRIVTEFAPTGFALVDNEGNIEYINPAFTGILGYPAGDIPDAATFTKKAFPDQEYRAQILELWEQEQKTTEQQGLRGIPVRIITVRCKDGTDKKIRFRRVVLQDRRVLVAIEDNPSD